MKKLHDVRGEEAIELLAELIEPAVEICSDKELVNAVKNGRKLDIVKVAMSTHKAEVMRILYLIDNDGQSYEEYAKSVNVFTIPMKIIEALNDPELMQLFTSAEQTEVATSFGSALEK